ncbi:MAG: GerMN domain-containing protein [Bacillota bacterium]|nr:GerMN domain-containing protein [Bacillota bacterium]
MNKGKKVLLVIVTVIVSLGLMVGCTNFGTNQKPADEDPGAIVNPNPGQEQITAKVYFVDADAMYLVPEEVSITKDNRPLAELLVERLIAGPEDPDLGIVIPAEAKLLSLEIVDGIAYVNFSQEIKTKHWGGSTGETMTIYSVVNTLAELPEINEVQFLIEGEKQESIWGHGYTMEPFSPSVEIIDPEYR